MCAMTKSCCVLTVLYIQNVTYSADILLGRLEEIKTMYLKTRTNIQKCLVWSLNVTAPEHVHGSVLINHLLSCRSKIKFSQL
jgi:hypothetical protein